MSANEDKAQPIVVCDADFDSEVLKCKQPVVVAFWAPWSRPCHVIDATLEEVAAACAGSAKVVKVNADDNPDLSLWYEIRSIPTLLYFVDGNLRATLVGTASKEAILAKLQTVSSASDAKSLTSDASQDHQA